MPGWDEEEKYLVPRDRILKSYRRGTLVIATRHVDPDGADVPKGMLGVVFEEAQFHELNSGPMVRWMSGGACNVYIDDVELVDMQGTMPWRLFLKEVVKQVYVAKITGARFGITVLGRNETEVRFEPSLEAAYSFVYNMCTRAGIAIDRLKTYFEDPTNQYFYAHIVNQTKEGDGHNRHILFQRLTGRGVI